MSTVARTTTATNQLSRLLPYGQVTDGRSPLLIVCRSAVVLQLDNPNALVDTWRALDPIEKVSHARRRLSRFTSVCRLPGAHLACLNFRSQSRPILSIAPTRSDPIQMDAGQAFERNKTLVLSSTSSQLYRIGSQHIGLTDLSSSTTRLYVMSLCCIRSMRKVTGPSEFGHTEAPSTVPVIAAPAPLRSNRTVRSDCVRSESTGRVSSNWPHLSQRASDEVRTWARKILLNTSRYRPSAERSLPANLRYVYLLQVTHRYLRQRHR